MANDQRRQLYTGTDMLGDSRLNRADITPRVCATGSLRDIAGETMRGPIGTRLNRGGNAPCVYPAESVHDIAGETTRGPMGTRLNRGGNAPRVCAARSARS